MATLSSRRLEETAELGRALVSGLSGAGLLVADTALRVQAIDGEIYDSLGYAHCVGRLIRDVIPAAAWEVLAPRYHAALGGRAQSFHYDAVGVPSAHSVRIAPIHDGADVMGVMVLSRRKDLERQMQEAAHRDPLTDLYNRRGFTEEFQRTVAYTYRYERSGAVLMIDLDGFKEVNDRLGHKAGDELLAGIAEKLRDRLRRSDLIGRLGGDEFAVVLVEVSAAEATRVADDIRELVRRQGRLVSGDEPGATASIGVAPFDGAAGQVELLNRADQAM